jgi:hypothetical protein
MNRFFFLSTALFIATGVTGAATISQHAYAGSGTSCAHYAGHASVEGKWGSERSITETAAFVPLACREDRLLYGDVRLKADNRGNREGNVGLGVRALKENGVAGGYVYLDRRRSGATEKLFTQTTLGAEWLAEDWEVRSNAYVPLSGKKQMGTSGGEALSDPYLANNGIYVDVAGQNAVIEKPLWGVDAEAGLKLPGKDFWMHAGVFAFDASEAEGLAGGRLRATYSVTENIALTAEGQYDNVRGRQGWLGVRYTVPFGGPKTKHTGLKSRMTADPVRDVDIVTAAVEEEVAPAYTAPVENTETETAQRVLHVDNSAGGGGDGTLENPFNTLAAAQAVLQDFDVLYINRGTGTTAGMNAGLAVAQNNVWVIGSGTDFVYDAGRFSAPVEENLNGTVLVAAGLAPIITNAGVNGDGINVTGADTYIGGVTVNGAARHGIYALSSTGTDLGGITMQDVTVTNNIQNGIFVEGSGAGSGFSNVSVTGATTTGNAGRGVYIFAQNDGDITTATVDNLTSQNNTGASGLGMEITATGAGSTISTVNVTDATISGNTAQGVHVQAAASADIATVTLNDVTSQNNTGGVNAQGIQLTATGAGSTITNASIQNSIVSGNQNIGFYTEAASDAVISNLDVSDFTSTGSTGSNGISLDARVRGQITNVSYTNITSSGHAGRGLYTIAQSDGDIGTLTINNLTSQNNTGASGRGIEVTATGAGSTIGTATVMDSIFSGNAQQGYYTNNTSGGVMNALTLQDTQSTANATQGIYILLQTNGDIGTLLAEGLTVQNNAGGITGMEVTAQNTGSLINTAIIRNSDFSNNGRGLSVTATTDGDIGTLDIDNVIASNNTALNGILVTSVGGGSLITSATVQNATASGNISNGISIQATTNGFIGTANVLDVTTSSNSGRGVYVTTTGGADITTVSIDNVTSLNNITGNGRGLEISATGAGSTITTATVTDSIFSGNANIGAYITPSTSGLLTSATISNVTASGNAAQGIYVHSQSDGDLGTALLEDITVQSNTGASGIGVQIIATGIGSTINSATVDNALASGNASFGLYATAATSGLLNNVEMKNSISSGNTGAGIEILAQSSGTINTATLTDSTTSGNGSNGTYILGATGGDMGAVTVERLTSQNNTGVNGRGLTVQVSTAGTTIASVAVRDSLFSGNAQQGMWVQMNTDSDIGAITIDELISSNNSGVGLHVVTTETGTTLGGLTIRDSLFENNGGAGIYLQSTTLGSMTGVDIADVTASGNAQEGFNFYGLNNAVLSLRMQNSTATGNGTNGVYIDDDTPAAYTADLGGGTLAGTGGNRIFGNTGVDLRVDHDAAQLKAEGNWWGVGTGLAGGEVTLEGGSTVDSTPFLAADPGP